jgi:ABC-type lipoprotein release transport system permease subunit
VRPTDPVLVAAVTILTGAIALVACIEPARRATRVDPIKVLTQQ